MKDLLFSVCIPCYNVERFISKCLDNILLQKFDNLEVICVDDGSFDNTYKILTEYSLNYDNVKVVRHIYNHQLLMARKTATLLASGQYVMYVDPDDVLENNIFIKLLEIIKLHSECDVIEFRGSAWNFEDTNQPMLLKPIYAKSYEGSLCDNDIFRKLMSDEIGSMIWNKVYKTEVAKKVYSYLRIVNLYSREDIYFCSVLYSIVHSYYGVEDVLYKYSVGTGTSTNNTVSLPKFKEMCKAADIIYSLVEIYYDHLIFDELKAKYLIGKIKNWSTRKLLDFILAFKEPDEISEAVRYFVSKWIDIDKLKLLIKINDALIFSICQSISDCLFFILEKVRSYYPAIIQDQCVREYVQNLDKLKVLTKCINSKIINAFTKENVLILGSCVARDVFNFKNSKYNVLHYCNGISPFSLISQRSDIQLEVNDLKCRSPFEKRSCCIDWNKSFEDFYLSDQIKTNILIIDLCDARLNIGKSVSSKVFDFYFSVSTTFKENYNCDKFNSKLEKFNYTVLNPLTISDLEWSFCIKNYCRLISEFLKPKKVIVIETMFAEKWIDGSCVNVFENVSYIRELNLLLNKLYKCLYQNLTINYQVITLPDNFIADKNHKFGLFPCHYTSDVYEYIYYEIEKNN